MIGLFAIQYFSATSGLSTVLWAATMSAVIARLAMSDKENKRLLEQVRTDALTGLANRGRMQVDLPSLFERASEEQPDVRMYAQKESRRVAQPHGEPAKAKVSPCPQPTSDAK